MMAELLENQEACLRRGLTPLVIAVLNPDQESPMTAPQRFAFVPQTWWQSFARRGYWQQERMKGSQLISTDHKEGITTVLNLWVE